MPPPTSSTTVLATTPLPLWRCHLGVAATPSSRTRGMTPCLMDGKINLPLEALGVVRFAWYCSASPPPSSRGRPRSLEPAQVGDKAAPGRAQVAELWGKVPPGAARGRDAEAEDVLGQGTGGPRGPAMGVADVRGVVGIAIVGAVSPGAVSEIALDKSALGAVGVGQVPAPTAARQIKGARRLAGRQVGLHLERADEGRDVARQLGRLGPERATSCQRAGPRSSGP